MSSEYQKNVGFIGGVSLLASSITGPGLVVLPTLFQSAGWFFPTLVYFIMPALSGLGALFLMDSMTKYPGNGKFQKNIELTTLVKQFYGDKWAYVMQLFLFLSMQAVNITSIIISIQTFDNLLIQLFGKTCGFGLSPTTNWLCVDQVTGSNSPFVGNIMFITFGFVILLLFVVPLSLMNLTDNILIQFVSFCATIFISLQWVDVFAQHGYSGDLMPAFGPDMSQVVGTVMFNYAFAMVIPSWINSSHPSVPIKKTVWTSLILATSVYLLVGLTGGASYRIPPTSNILSTIASTPFNKGSVAFSNNFVFPIFSLITSIPVYIIVIRVNLIQSKVFDKTWATFWSSIFPFFVVIPFQTGGYVNALMNWTSLIFTSVTNFIVPFVIYIFLDKRNIKYDDDEEDEELEILDYDLAMNSLAVNPNHAPVLEIEAEYKLNGSVVAPSGPSTKMLSSPSKMSLAAGERTLFHLASRIQAKKSIQNLDQADTFGRDGGMSYTSSLARKAKLIQRSNLFINMAGVSEDEEETPQVEPKKKESLGRPTPIPEIVLTDDDTPSESTSLKLEVTNELNSGTPQARRSGKSITFVGTELAPKKSSGHVSLSNYSGDHAISRIPEEEASDSDNLHQSPRQDPYIKAFDDIRSEPYNLPEGKRKIILPEGKHAKKQKFNPLPAFLQKYITPLHAAMCALTLTSIAVFGTIIYCFSELASGNNVFAVAE